MNFAEHREKGYLIVTLVPDFIVVHTGIQSGEPTIVNTRIPTQTAALVYGEQGARYFQRAYELDDKFGFASFCFEAGREYQRNRKLRKHIDEALYAGSEEWMRKENEKEARLQRGAGI